MSKNLNFSASDIDLLKAVSSKLAADGGAVQSQTGGSGSSVIDTRLSNFIAKGGHVDFLSKMSPCLLVPPPAGYAELVQRFDAKKRIPSVIELKGVACSPHAMRCFMFKEDLYKGLQERLRTLIPQLRVAPATDETRVVVGQTAQVGGSDARARAELVLQTLKLCAEAQDATNIKNYWLGPAGSWGTWAYPHNQVEAQAPTLDVCPAGDKFRAVPVGPAYTRVSARMQQLVGPVTELRGVFAQSQPVRAPMWDPNKRALHEFGHEPAVARAGLPLLGGGSIPRWLASRCAAERARVGASLVYSTFESGAVFFGPDGDINPRHRNTATRYAPNVTLDWLTQNAGRRLVEMRPPPQPKQSRFAAQGGRVTPEMQPFAAGRVYELGPALIEEYARVWAQEIVATPYKDVVLAGVYNWCFQTEMMIFSGLVEAGADYAEQVEAAFEEAYKAQVGTTTDLFAQIAGTYGAVIGAIIRVFLLILLPLIKKLGVAVGCIPGFLDVPFSRVPMPSDILDDPCDALRGEITTEKYTEIRNVTLPAIEAATGIPLAQFEFMDDQELFGKPPIDWGLLATVGAIGGGGLWYTQAPGLLATPPGQAAAVAAGCVGLGYWAHRWRPALISRQMAWILAGLGIVGGGVLLIRK